MYSLQTGPDQLQWTHTKYVQSIMVLSVFLPSVIFYRLSPQIYVQSVTAQYNIVKLLEHVPEVSVSLVIR